MYRGERLADGGAMRAYDPHNGPVAGYEWSLFCSTQPFASICPDLPMYWAEAGSQQRRQQSRCRHNRKPNYQPGQNGGIGPGHAS